MKQTAIITGICGLFLVAALAAAGCTMTSGGTGTPAAIPSPVPAVTTTAPPACGFTTCHGLDLACSTDFPQVCTMEYQIGDRCRQYASCGAGSGGCTLVLGPEFTACRTCVEKCQTSAGPDALAAFSCEEKC